jgi:chromosome segregation ATPase
MIPVRDHETKVEGLQGELLRKEDEIVGLKRRLEDMDTSLKCLMEELQKTEVLRKHLHNHVQMLRGSMRVFCRIKPL